jgi:hypothetical protein
MHRASRSARAQVSATLSAVHLTEDNHQRVLAAARPGCGRSAATISSSQPLEFFNTSEGRLHGTVTSGRPTLPETS